MELSRFFLPYKNVVLNEYVKNGSHPYYHYPLKNPIGDEERIRELQGRKFPRKEVTRHIRQYMKRFSISKNVEESLIKLEREDSVVVIGGQQAGLLTGPLYTIYKMMTIVLLAKEKEARLRIPVVPIFWVAGEDHDFLEINHVFVEEEHILKKKQYNDDSYHAKHIVSKRQLDHVRLRQWYEELIQIFGETEYSKHLLSFYNRQLTKAETYTDFFVAIANELFQNYGLLFVDSSQLELRKIEFPYFISMIEKGEEIGEALKNRQQKMVEQGWEKVIHTDQNCFHLFYEMDGIRHLLYTTKEGNVYSANGKIFSKEELIELARSNPEYFSNNVVTRPLMQELLFPTIAFVAGPGEMQYWAELKEVFERLDLRMPPIVPRLTITLLERNLESELKELGLQVERVLMEGTKEEKKKALEMLKDQNLLSYIEKGKKEVEWTYQQTIRRIMEYDKGLEGIIKKNEQLILQQFHFLEKKVEEVMERKYSVLLTKYDRIENRLFPFGRFQERCWNISYFFNKYGMDLIDRLMELPFEINGYHYIVKL